MHAPFAGRSFMAVCVSIGVAVSVFVIIIVARCSFSIDGVSVSAYVGHDHCGVFSNVFGDSVPPSSSAAAVVDDKPESAAVPAAEGEGDAVSRLVAEKKRKFHSGRLLELKNLPDGCTEQVGDHSGIDRPRPLMSQFKLRQWSEGIVWIKCTCTWLGSQIFVVDL